MSRNKKIAVMVIVVGLLIVIWIVGLEPGAAAQGEHRHGHAPASAKQLKNPLTMTEENIARGRTIYDQNCASCHGADGKSQTERAAAMKVKPANLTALQGRTDGEIYWVVTNGIKASGMPAFGAKLSDQDRWQVVLYVESLQGDHRHATEPATDAKPGRATHGGHDRAREPVVAGDVHAGHDLSGMMETVTGGPFRSMHAVGSGTALQPASTPMAAWHWMPGEWMLMLHGELKAGFNHQGGPRGVGKAESQNWLMLMAERNIGYFRGPGRMMLRAMMSAEALTAPHGGFPQLFQNGETYRRRPIIDAQHPHDLFMELAASYTIPLSEDVSFQLYGGPVAEPALGPVAFPHRASAMENPAAPLGHHFQDSTHITHGVVTGALTAWRFKLEGSLFHGAEPDENRATIDLGMLDSYSFRTWFTPTPNWAMQFSYGRLKDPEVVEPGILKRMTASIFYNRPFIEGNWASSLIWGRNDEEHGDANSYLFESTLNFRRNNHLYTRIELSDREGVLADNIFGRPGVIRLPVIPKDSRDFDLPEEFERAFRVAAFTFGGVRDFINDGKVRIGLGADVTFYNKPSELDPIYGRRPASFHVFLRFRPTDMR
jgi:mono/diheme cytochrome c family protein